MQQHPDQPFRVFLKSSSVLDDEVFENQLIIQKDHRDS